MLCLVGSRQVTEVPVHQSAANLGFRNVNQVLKIHVSICISTTLLHGTHSLHSVVKVVSGDNIAVKQATLGVSNLLASLLVDQQPSSQSVGINLEETSQLLDVHCSVKLEVRTDSRAPHVVLDLLHEDGKVVLDGVNVDRRILKVRRSGRDESGAGLTEEILKDGERLGATELHASKLLTVLLTEGRVDSVVETSGVEGDANGDKSVHLVALLCDAIVLSVLLEVLCARNVDEDVGEHADGVGVAVHHHVRETDVVVGAELGSHDTGEHGFLVKLNVVQSLEGHAKVTEQAVDAEETDEREVSKHLVERAAAVLAGVGGGILTTLASLELLLNLTTLNKRVQNVEDRVASPGVGVLAEDLSILVVVLLEGNLLAVGAEAVELVNELVNHLPGPVVLRAVSLRSWL